MNPPKIIEQEPMIVTTHGVFKQKEAPERLEQIRQTAAKEHERRQKEQKSAKVCPIRSASNSMGNAVCTEECGFYTHDSCALVVLVKEAPEIQNAEGKKCPLATMKCSKGCALYENGCAVTRLAAKRKVINHESV